MYWACEYVFLTPTALGRRRYRAVCGEFDLEPVASGYGALLCHDDQGREVTKLTADPDYLRTVVETIWQLRAIRTAGGAHATQVNAERFALTRPGWPTQQCRCGV
jgi:hypothetical protein